MDMDWEPEVPGQWNTPRRIRCQRAAPEAAFSNTFPHTSNLASKHCPTDWEPEIPGQFNTPLRNGRKRDAAEAGFSETILDTGFYTPTIAVESIVSRSDYFAPISNILASAFRIFHQFYSAAVRGARATRNTASSVAGSKHVIEIRRTAANGFESVKRRTIDSGITRPVAPTAQQIIRNKKPVAQLKSSRSPHCSAGTRQTVPQETPLIELAPSPLSESIEKMPPHSEAPATMEAQTSPPKLRALEPQIDREALGAKLLASFTPRPIPGARELLAKAQQPASVPPIDGQPNPSLKNGETTEMRPLLEHSNSPKLYDIRRTKFDRPDLIKPSLKSANSGLKSRRSASDTYEGSNTLEKRSSLPEISSSEMHGSITRSNTVSITPKTEKTVRFEINDTNGLPQEYKRSFYRYSKIGEWAPSSPWDDDQVLGCTSDLKSNLNALLREDSWLPLPLTLVNRGGPDFSDDHRSTFPEDDLSFSPPSIESPPQVIKSSTFDHSPTSVDILDELDQHTPDQQLVGKSPVVQALATPSFPDSPYTRIRELVSGSFRKMFPPSRRGASSNISNISPTQEVMETSISGHRKTSQMAESNHVTSLLDPPTVEIGPGSVNQNFASTIDSSVSIDQHDRSQELIKSSGRSDESSRSHDELQLQKYSAEVVLADAMYGLKMSKHGTEKIVEGRKKKAVAEATRRAAEEAAAAKAKAKAEEGERMARSHRRTPKEKLVKSLSEEWEENIRKAICKGPGGVWTTTVSGTDLRGKDFMTVLGERQWLNDEIINAYVEWVVDYANKKAGKDGRNATPKVVAQNSFFYKNLSEQGPEKVSRWMTRKKAGGKKLLEVETVLIPVNNANHWTLIVVSPRERTIEYLDSFSGASKTFVNNTKRWLKQELGHDWREEEWRVLSTKSAEQRNGFDCGVFLLTNAECVAGGLATDSYDSRDMTEQRRRVAAVLLNMGFGNGLVPAEEL